MGRASDSLDFCPEARRPASFEAASLAGTALVERLEPEPEPDASSVNASSPADNRTDGFAPEGDADCEPFRWYYFDEWKNAVGAAFDARRRQGPVEHLGVLVNVELCGNPYDPDMVLTLRRGGACFKKDIIVGSGEVFRRADGDHLPAP